MNPLDILLPKPTPPRDGWSWATVTSVSPLRVQMDGPDEQPLDVTPDALMPVGVGDRVRVHRHGRRIVVHGPARGQPFAMASGVAEITMAGSTAVVTVTLPAGRFTVPPHLSWGRSHSGASSAAAVVGVNPAAVTANSFPLGGYGSYTGTVTVWWTAVQMTAGSASG